MMKQYKLPQVLQEEEDYEAIYDANEENKDEPEKEEPLPPYYKNEKEYRFYGDDVDFLRFHKRTTQNVLNVLQELIDSNKQVMQSAVRQTHKVTINHIELNKACSVVNAWWTIAKVTDRR